MEIVAGAVGWLFSLVAGALVLLHAFFRKHGERVPGKVIAVERYVSRTTRGEGTSAQTFYRPIVEYSFEGEPVWFSSTAGQSEVRHTIGEDVTVLSLPRGPEYCTLESNVLLVFALFFGLAGAVAGGIVWATHGPALALGGLVLAAATLGGGTLLARRVLTLDQVVDGLLKADVETRESLASREVFWTRADLGSEVKRVALVGLVISSVFLLGALGGTYFFWTKTPPRIREALHAVIGDPSSLSQLKAHSQNGPFLGFLFCGVMAVLGVYSLLYGLRRAR